MDKKLVKISIVGILFSVLAGIITGCSKGHVLLDIPPEAGYSISITDLSTGEHQRIKNSKAIKSVISNLNEVAFDPVGELKGENPGDDGYEVQIYLDEAYTGDHDETFCFTVFLNSGEEQNKILYDGNYWVDEKGDFDYNFISDLAKYGDVIPRL